ncbi:MAG: multicopper oxidase family protein [Synechocystis sp.]|nr:multicopper oxidase family protein [Synechocystis sp.]
MMVNLNRRQFLSLGAMGTGLALATHWGINNHNKSLVAAPSFPSSSIYRSQNGLLELTLAARYAPVNLGRQIAQLLTYNGQIPAPRLEAQPGDTVRIHLTNQFNQPTNLHYHGLHIPPTGTADNVFLKIPPQERFTYEFKIPANHRSGTFWYHPHLHGYVADQVAGGLAGLFVIRGELDQIPAIKAAQEAFLVLQDFALDNQGQLLNSSYLNLMAGREGNVIIGNGQVNPSFSLPQNGLLRLRLLNASVSHFYRLSLENHPFYLIATDGGAIAKPIELNELLLAPGERADILIQGDRAPGQYRLLNLPYNRGGMGMMGMGMMGRGSMGAVQNTPMTLATFTYGEPTRPTPLPERLLPVTTLPVAQLSRRFTLNHGVFPGMGMVFMINGQAFDHQRIDTQVTLGTVEDWEIVNTGVMDHPFHLHVNDFQVISRDDRAVPYPAWKDTVVVKTGEKVRIRVNFQDYAGKTVYHCHILDHEELGMMGILNIANLNLT